VSLRTLQREKKVFLSLPALVASHNLNKCFVEGLLMRILSVLTLCIFILSAPQQGEAAEALTYHLDNPEFTEKRPERPDIDPGDGEGCPDCPPVLVISVNGVPGKDEPPADGDMPGKDFHDWIKDNITGNENIPVDPEVSGCVKNPKSKDRIDAIHDIIDNWKASNPCGIVIVVGHSMGAITTHGLDGGRVDCRAYLDPPFKWCGFFSQLFCPAQRAACKAKDDIMNDPNYHEWEYGPNGVDFPHYPWDPKFNDPNHPDYVPTNTCNWLSPVRQGIEECLASKAPNCPDYQDAEPYVCSLMGGEGDGSSQGECHEEVAENFLEFLTVDDILYLEELEDQQGALTLIIGELASSCDL